MSKAFIGNLESLTDEDLVDLSQNGNSCAVDVIVRRYSDMVTAKARLFSSTFVTVEDMSQEGMLGLLSAIYNFNKEKQVKFKTYANVCVHNYIVSTLRKNNRKKCIPLNSFISLDIGDIEIADANNLEDVIIANEQFLKMMEVVEHDLSLLEKSVITLYLEGKSYGEVALRLGLSTKSVDNAMQRVLKKFRRSSI